MPAQTVDPRRALTAAVAAAREAGQLMRDNLNALKRVNVSTQHDIKLELDVECQKRIERRLLRAFPGTAILGEEGVLGDPEAAGRWVVDPIDGTVNFTYGIPHACVSIAWQTRVPEGRARLSQPAAAPPNRRHGEHTAPSLRGTVQEFKARIPSVNSPVERYQTQVGVVYDPFCDELWTAVRGGPARLNGRAIQVSTRGRLNEAIISLGFAKNKATLNRMLPVFNHLVHRVRKIRIMGAAALAMVYVASGRMDAYTEYGIRLWDIAAGGLILECAGGDFGRQSLPGEHTFAVCATNGRLRAGRFCSPERQSSTKR